MLPNFPLLQSENGGFNMKNIEKYQNLISKGEVDALLLTSKHNRQYAAEYCIAEGVAVICKT